ncbi:MAG: homoserine dehydrogenase [Cellulosilyticaceae bacterium]
MNVAVLGYGTVGAGVVEILTANKETIEKKANETIELKYILDIRDFKEDPMQDKIIQDFEIILKDDTVNVIAEAMGGLEPAYSYVKSALQVGKSVVTSNKELVAAYGPELIKIAKENKCNFLFEASVGGGIPIIRPLNMAFTGDNIEEITGILNGTTNFILTKMKNEGRRFESVLLEAQELGYAERNPAADVEGHDACRKIAILASLAFGEHVDYKEVSTQGITHITSEDIAYAKEMGYTIKLLGTCKKQGEEISTRVAPTLIPNQHPLANINDVFNAVFVKGDMVGDVMFYGRGAGKLPTASAMVADIIDAVRHEGTHVNIFWSREKLAISPKDEMVTSYFVRIEGQPSYASVRVKDIFGEVEEVKSLDNNEYVFITKKEAEKEFTTKIEQVKEDFKVINCIHIEK